MVNPSVSMPVLRLSVAGYRLWGEKLGVSNRVSVSD